MGRESFRADQIICNVSRLGLGQSHTRHLYRKNTLVMSFREAQRREIFGYKASLDPTEKISRSYRRSK